MDACNPRAVKTLRRFMVFACWAAIAVGLAGLAGWAFHVPFLKSVLYGRVAIKPNACIALICLGISLWLQRTRGGAGVQKFSARLLAGTAGLIGLLSLTEILFGWDFGIDQLLFQETAEEASNSVRPGLMSPVAALDFVLLGLALFHLDWVTLHRYWPSQTLALTAGLSSIFALMDLALDPGTSQVHISPHTSVALFGLSFGLVCARTDRGLAALLASNGLGGAGARRMFPAAVLVPILMGYLGWRGEVSGLYQGWTGLALMIVITILLLAGVTVWTALLIERMDGERRTSTEALRGSEARLKLQFERMPIGCILWNKDFRVESWNPAAEEIFGFPGNEVLGHHPYDCIVPGHEQPHVDELFRRLLAGDSTAHSVNENVTKSGRRIICQWTNTPLRGPGEEIIGVLSMVQDITERKQAEEALRKSEASLSRAQAVAHVGSWQLDIVNDRLTWSDEAYRIFAIPIGTSLTLERFLQTVHSEDREYVQNSWSAALRGAPYDVEHRIRAGDATKWVREKAEMELDSDGRPLLAVGTVQDITERKRAEAEVRKLNDELEQRVLRRTAQLQAANQELEAFTYSVSHDLRAPLRHIGGFSRILMEEYAPQIPQEAQRYLERIQEGTHRMGLLVDDLLNLARVGRHELRREVTGLNSLLEEVLAELKADCEGRQIKWKIGSLPFVECDPALMKQVFHNLLSNALKFSRPREPAVIEVGQAEQAGAPAVFVRDNGVGFSMKYADKLFGVFQRLHRPEDFEGTGVGLATVQRIIHKHGGKVWAQAELDRGATFYFTLATLQATTNEPAAVLEAV